jgi:hypothetical protein
MVVVQFNGTGFQYIYLIFNTNALDRSLISPKISQHNHIPQKMRSKMSLLTIFISGNMIEKRLDLGLRLYIYIIYLFQSNGQIVSQKH